jgi:glutamate N-acetyltransferase/amino-acid N-acetyltransferase
VVSSSLVKAAVHGHDPNWGRIAGAAGNAHLADGTSLEAAGLSRAEAGKRGGGTVALDPALLRIGICGTDVFAGVPLTFDKATVSAAMSSPEVLIRLHLGAGDGIGEAFGCDLTERYVIENSEYST